MFQGMEYVYAVYKEKSFSKAARRLFISQPSLSASVKREEEAIGYPIFDRSTKPIGLTEAGKRYIDTVEQIMSMQGEFSEYLNDLGNLRTGSLKLGGSSLYSSWVLPPLMGMFAKKYPLVKLELIEESTSKLEKMLQSGEIDFMLDNCELDEEVFERQLFRKEYLILAVPRRFAVNDSLKEYQITAEAIRSLEFLNERVPEVNLKLFTKEPFVLLKPENDTRERAEALFKRNRMKPEIVFELDQQMTSYNITCSGMGISFISDTLISNVPMNDDVVYYKLEEKKSNRNLYFYWKRGRYFNKIMQRFLRDVVV